MNTLLLRHHFIIIGALISLYCPLSYAQNPLLFPNACAKGNRIVVAAVGDLLFHRPLQYKAQSQGFASLWQEAQPYLSAANVVYGNLEGPIGVGILPNGKQVADPLAWNTYLLSRYPSFNYHPSVANALKISGFHVVSNANNHILDRGALGVDKTIETLDAHNVYHIGAKSTKANSHWYHIIEKDGFKLAFIGCTEHTNGINDKYHQVLSCFKSADRSAIISTIGDLKKQADVIIVTPHWGAEYQTFPNRAQKEFAKQVLDAGASAVIGSHPHVLQPVEKYITPDGRATLISYSLGNFVSYQGTPKNRTSMILLLGLTKTAKETIINGVRFVPLFMENRSGIEKIHLRVLSNAQLWNNFANLFAPIIPLQNAIFSLPIITNPECAGN
ncbi:MAG: CapA family protein [Candidatus Berkiella sp.]